ncbi:MAG: hypothetical protein K2X38_10560, partial [Gemmataceae bacterium]|nr:hypothetical protein [Gemmataceae bacterium]
PPFFFFFRHQTRGFTNVSTKLGAVIRFSVEGAQLQVGRRSGMANFVVVFRVRLTGTPPGANPETIDVSAAVVVGSFGHLSLYTMTFRLD